MAAPPGTTCKGPAGTAKLQPVADVDPSRSGDSPGRGLLGVRVAEQMRMHALDIGRAAAAAASAPTKKLVGSVRCFDL